MTDNTPKPTYKLLVRLICGNDLAVKDITGSSDPYLKIYLNDKQIYKSTTIIQSLNPKWSETCEYLLYSHIKDEDFVFFECWDWDRLTHDDFMGCYTFYLKEIRNLINQKKKITFKLEPRSGKKDKVKGTISVEFRVIEIEEKYTILAKNRRFLKYAPSVMYNSFNYLKEKGYFEKKGIFRITCQYDVLYQYKKLLLDEIPIYVNEIDNPHILCCFIKQYLRDLKEPVFTYKLYYPLLEILKIEDENTRINNLMELLKTLPSDNYETLNILFLFLNEVGKYGDKNMMSSEALSIVFAPNLLKCEDSLQLFKGLGQTNQVCQFMIENGVKIFNKKTLSEFGSGAIKSRPSNVEDASIKRFQRIPTSYQIGERFNLEKRSPPPVPGRSRPQIPRKSKRGKIRPIAKSGQNDLIHRFTIKESEIARLGKNELIEIHKSLQKTINLVLKYIE